MSALTGTGSLLRLALRRDRVRLCVWVVVAAGVMAGSAKSTAALYPTQTSLDRIGHQLSTTPATLALYGPAAQLDTVGGLVMWKPGGLLLVLAGLLGLLTVVRHTRAEEESGLTELTGAGAVGALAPLAAAVLLAGGAAVGLGAFVGLGLAASGAGGIGAVGAELSFAATSFAFAGVGALAAQVALSGRAANGLGGAVLGASYLLRAVADGSARGSGPALLSWLTPVGWVQHLEPYATRPRWWVLLLPLGFGLGLSAVAAGLRSRRDLGAALLASRPGPASAGRQLSGAFGLAWRLQRGPLAAWGVGLAVFGGFVGWLASQVGSLLGSGDGARDLFDKLGGRQHPADLVDTYFAASLATIGVAVSAYAVLAVLRLRTEEEAGRVEPLLAAGVARGRLVASHLALALGGPVALLAVAGLAAGLAHAVDGGSERPVPEVGRVLVAALAQAPAVWLVAGVAAALVGLIPRRAVLAWAVLGAAVLLGPLGAVVGLPGWAQDLSPYAHVPHLPAASAPASDLGPLLVLAVLAALVIVAGLLAYRRRDIPA